MYAAVYTARAHEHLQSRVRAVYMARIYGCVLAVYTAVYMARTWPYNGGVHVCVCTRLCTRPRTGRVHGRVRAVSDRVDGCVRAVYRDEGRVHGSCAVCYYDFLCKRHLLSRNIQL